VSHIGYGLHRAGFRVITFQVIKLFIKFINAQITTFPVLRISNSYSMMIFLVLKPFSDTTLSIKNPVLNPNVLIITL